MDVGHVRESDDNQRILFGKLDNEPIVKTHYRGQKCTSKRTVEM